jgi:hypothetical protein
VCYFTDGEQASSSRRHTVRECKREVAAQIMRQGRHMDKWMKRVEAGADQGVCAGCSVPWAVCRSWKWDKQHRGWVKDPGKGCQYRGVLIPVLMAMMKLGSAGAVRDFEELLHGFKVDPISRVEVSEWFCKGILWEGVEAGQIVVALMKLARANRLLGVSGLSLREGRPFKKERLEKR